MMILEVFSNSHDSLILSISLGTALLLDYCCWCQDWTMPVAGACSPRSSDQPSPALGRVSPSPSLSAVLTGSQMYSYVSQQEFTAH